MAKNGVIMYYDLLEQLKDFTDEQFGKLTRALLQYDKDSIIPEFNDLQLKLAFQMLKPSIDRNKEDYLSKCEKNRENVLKRWNKHDTNEYVNIQSNTMATDNDNDNDNDNVKDNDIINKEKEIYKEKVDWESMFETLWSKYPRKANKILAKKTFEHKIRGLGEQECIEKCNAIYKAQTISIREWEKDNREKDFIPHYSSWLNNNIPNSPKYKGR